VRGQLLDTLTFGPRRRRRAMMRRLRELDRIYEREAASGANPWAAPRPRRRGATRRLATTVLALVLVTGGVWSFAVNVVGVDVGLESFRRAITGGTPGTGTGSYEFMAVQRDDPRVPVAYSPCREIPVVLNDTLAPDGSEGLVEESVEEIAELTGLDLRFAGTTGEQPVQESPRVRSQPVLVAWTTPERIPELAGDIAGLGGSSTRTGGLSGRTQYVSGQVALDADQLGEILDQRGRDYVKAVVLHELGHVVGLGHTDDPSQLMHAENVGRLDFAEGDRAGLKLLGQGGC
jgi:hypothetical protein